MLVDMQGAASDVFLTKIRRRAEMKLTQLEGGLNKICNLFEK
jgi:hypothetical protein